MLRPSPEHVREILELFQARPGTRVSISELAAPIQRATAVRAHGLSPVATHWDGRDSGQ